MTNSFPDITAWNSHPEITTSLSGTRHPKSKTLMTQILSDDCAVPSQLRAPGRSVPAHPVPGRSCPGAIPCPSARPQLRLCGLHKQQSASHSIWAGRWRLWRVSIRRRSVQTSHNSSIFNSNMAEPQPRRGSPQWCCRARYQRVSGNALEQKAGKKQMETLKSPEHTGK